MQYSGEDHLPAWPVFSLQKGDVIDNSKSIAWSVVQFIVSFVNDCKNQSVPQMKLPCVRNNVCGIIWADNVRG